MDLLNKKNHRRLKLISKTLWRIGSRLFKNYKLRTKCQIAYIEKLRKLLNINHKKIVVID